MHNKTTLVSALFLLLVPGASLLEAQEYPETRVARIEVNPSTVSVRVGERIKIDVTPVDSRGREVESALLRVWAVGSSAWFDPETSEVLGLVPGQETLVARVRRATSDGPGFDDVRASIRVDVEPAPVTRIDLKSPDGPVYAGTRIRLSARAYSDHGPRPDVRVRWSSSDPAVFRFTQTGYAEALEPGRVRVTASAGSVSRSLDLRVAENPVRELEVTPKDANTRAGDVLRFDALAVDSSRKPVRDLPIEWSAEKVEDPAGTAYIDDQGAFVANDPGLYRITATFGDRSAVTQVLATPRPPRRDIELVAHGVVPQGHATTDLWVFEGLDGRDYAYTGTYSGNLMYVWDVTDPASPVISDSVAFDGRRVNDVKINAAATIAVVTSENASNRRNGISLLDIQDPSHPIKIVHFTDKLTGGIHNTWIEGDLVYAVNYGTQDLHIIDISDPTRPESVGRWGLDKDNKWLHDVTVQDGLAYLSYWDDGLVILDVGDGVAGGTPTEPAFVSQYRYKYRLGPETYGNTHHAIRYGDYVFVGDEIFGCAECINGPRGYVHVVDVSDIHNPREVAYYRVPEAGVHNMWAESGLLYVGYYQAGLRILDISGELRGDLYRQGREVAWYMTEDDGGTVPFSTFTWGAQPFKGRIYASDGNSGLWIVKLRPPESAPLP